MQINININIYEIYSDAKKINYLLNATYPYMHKKNISRLIEIFNNGILLEYGGKVDVDDDISKEIMSYFKIEFEKLEIYMNIVLLFALMGGVD